MNELYYSIKKYMPSILYPLYLEYAYYKNLHRWCNLKKPETYTEKMQWGKLNRNAETLGRLSDKIAVRKWVEERIGREYLIPMIGNPYSSINEIKFEELPDRFVIKANHGSGFNYIVNNKADLNIDKIKKLASWWLNHNYAFFSMELQYGGIKPLIYIEKNILEDGIEDLPDYKFFCFNGKVFCSYTMIDYVFDHSKGKLGFFDRDYNLMPYHRKDYIPITEQLDKPQNYEKMVEVAEMLSKGFSHVRVDLYNVDGKIYFGELTFTTNSGIIEFEPKEFDSILGEQWDIKTGI